MTTAPPKSRGPYAKSAKRRQAIARAVLDIVREKGHGNVTTAEVADRAGAAEATVLYHYPSKDHLLVAALQCADDETDEQFRLGVWVLDLDELKAAARDIRREENTMRLYVTLAGHAATPEHPAQEFFAEHYRKSVAGLSQLIEQRQSAGLAHPGLDPAEAARQAIAVWDGLQTQWLADPVFDLGEAIVTAFRRLTGQNWMEARRAFLDPRAGL
ncbi:TetR/AcrR family transcriptional regulator [Nonomuraea sp. GTA35]|uniref:TetR/AcrR family transcriptional regulator n=1 Tax=Nonomuraea sp. GTA35 TaxID=1676746 RepID=UPI0035C1BF71